MDLAPCVAELLDPPPPLGAPDVPGWWAATRALAAPDPVTLALRGGARADRLGWAFAVGYEAALWSLHPGRDPSTPAALCVTEEGPPHPRSIETTWDGAAVRGVKRFVTLGEHARELYVLAREGEEGGRPRLALVRVDADAAGVALEALPATRFVPEIPHAAVRLDGAAGERLPGDGWTDWVKPFRTVEDAFVHLATTAFLTARLDGWGGDPSLRERGAAIAVSLATLAGWDPSARATHLALSGAMGQVRELWDAIDPATVPEPDRARLERDRRLLDVAAGARAARLQKARAGLRG